MQNPLPLNVPFEIVNFPLGILHPPIVHPFPVIQDIHLLDLRLDDKSGADSGLHSARTHLRRPRPVDSIKTNSPRNIHVSYRPTT